MKMFIKEQDKKFILELLYNSAKRISKNSYSPYSKFKVGCAVLTDKQYIYTGVNIENASYNLIMCAERVAIYNAITYNEKITDIMLYTGNKTVLSCGACRQVMLELAPEATLHYKDKNVLKSIQVKDLMSLPFNKKI